MKLGCNHPIGLPPKREREMGGFGRLVALEIPALRRYSRKLTRDPVEAEDLLQSCLLCALAKEELWQPGTNLRRWLFTMLHNHQISNLRRRACERRNLDDTVRALALNAAPDPDSRLLADEIARAIAALPEGQREAIRRVVLGGMSYDEAASALAVPAGTLRSRIFRARTVLRKLIAEDAETGTMLPLPARPAASAGDGVRRLAA
jgi:RNA polymerase sigma-70 factor (ECF subfamily)